MKHVFTNAMTAHVFAQQTQAHGRSGNGSISFDGDTIHSYSTPVGRIVRNIAGDAVLLLTARHYSVTTSMHCGRICSAFPSNDVFRVPSLGVSGGRHRDPSFTDTPDHAVNLAHLLAKYESAKAGLRRQVSEPYGIAETLDWTARKAQGYARYFGLPCSIDTAADAASVAAFRTERTARVNTPANIAKRERGRVQRAVKREADDARRREASRVACLESVERVALWRQGSPIDLRYHEYRTAEGSAMLRLKPGKPETVQTSLGAEVPTDDARRAITAIRLVVASGTAWTRNGDGGIPVGHFTVDAIDAAGNLRAGCHVITWSEVVHFTTALGWGPK